MSRSLRVVSLFAIGVTACVDPSVGDPELEVSEAALVAPDPFPAHTQIASLNGAPGGCLDLPLGLPAGQTLWLQQFPCNAGSNQRWRFEPINTGVFRIHSSWNYNLCLDLPSGNAVSGQDLQLYPCNTGNNQLWFVSAQSASASIIRSILHLGLCVDVENATVNAPARVQLFTCHGGANQAWKFRTWLGNDGSVDGCNGNVRFGSGGPIVSPGGVNSFAMTTGVETLCSDSIPFPRDTVDCPAGTNWMVPDRRNGTADYPVACFQQ